jgi:ribosomal protein S18 acetylase RimI-like enzyme
VLTFGRATPEDALGLRRLLLDEAVRSYWDIIGDSPALQRDLLDHFASRAEALAEQLRSNEGLCWVARENKQIVGMCGFNPERRLIHSVYVAESMRGKGIGTALMQYALGECGPGRVVLLVAAENTGALRFYERLGFTVTGHGASWRFESGEIPEIEMSLETGVK